MKKLIRMLALALAMMLALSCCALAEGTADATQAPETTETTETADSAQTGEDAQAADENPVLFTFDGQEFRKDEVDATIQNLLSGNYITSAKDYETAVEYMIQNELIEAEIKERGLDQFTDDELAAFQTEAQTQWDSALDYYVSYFLTEDTDEARASTRAAGEEYYAAQGYSVETLVDSLKLQAAYEKLQSAVLEGQNVEPTEEEIQDVFNQYVEQDKESYENNIYTYELYMNYGAESWYQPSGYRGVLHILLDTDQELLDAYENAVASYEETLSGDADTAAAATESADPNATAAPTEKPVTKEDVEAAREALLAHHQKEIDDIYARLEKGESFESLIAVYGNDPGMQDEENLKNGYAVHPDSIIWDTAFTVGAFSEKMQKPGDVSDPVVGQNGIHIIYYLRDIPAGAVELSDDIRTQITDYLVNVKTNELCNEAIEAWRVKHEVLYNEEAIAAVSAAE